VVPATNPQIAAELVLTVAAVKTHLRALFRTVGLDDLPQSEKRRKLVAAAFASGLVRDRGF
jgi:DNA-binding NarL/FixJ family response regulator